MPGLIKFGLYVPDLHAARMWPCSAFVMPEIECGATPASKYRRRCGVESHAKLIWLCPVHAAIVACGGSICKDCAQRGGITRIVKIERLTEPLRM